MKIKEVVGKMKTVASHALGCKVNQYESEAIAELFLQKGYEVVDIEQKADVYVINTCTVTNFGDKKSRQLIRKVKRQNSDAIVAVVGCYAQTAPEEISKVEGVNLIIGTKGRNNIVELVENYKPQEGITNIVSEIMKEKEFEHLSIQKLTNRTRAYLKIQDGCSQFCSYCIIPYARGPIRSRDPKDIIDEVKILAENGFKEIILTGIHVASYGKDLDNIHLLDIIKKVHDVKGIERIRLSSIEPNIVTEEFVKEVVNLNKVCHHFHLSLQSGCEKTLKAMNRKYTAQKYKEAVTVLRKYMPDVALTTDIIVGFPNETQKDFDECFEFANDTKFSKIHVFTYSPKKGTPAATMDGQIPNAVKAERSKILIELSINHGYKFMEKYLEQNIEVLFEQKLENNIYEGHTSNFMRVSVKNRENLVNSIRTVKIKEIKGELALGELV